MSLGKFLIRRVLQGVFVVWGVITVLFGLRAVSPGDPVNLILDPAASEELREQVREDLLLNEPIPVQYVDYLQGLLMGDFGRSYRSRRDVLPMILERIPATLELAIAATVVALLIAIPLGVISATRRKEPADYGATMFSLIGISTPNFWLGIMLILLLSVQFGIFPTGRRPFGLYDSLVILVTTGNLSYLLVWLKHITLPAITLGTYFTALITRLTRSGMLDELGKPYATAAQAKGIPGVLVRYKHVLRNTMIPIITVLGLQLGTLIGGAVITETVFSWHGLGLLLIGSIRELDWPLMQGIIIFIGVSFVVINIVVDALYAYLNPRVVAE